MIEEYIWKGKKNAGVQENIKMIDMSQEDLQRAYDHCKNMLYNTQKNSLGRYNVKEEIKMQIKKCNTELAVRWFLSLTNSNNEPTYTRYSLLNEIEAFCFTNNLKPADISKLTLKDIYNGLPVNFTNVDISTFQAACKDVLGKFNKSHLTLNFIINLGLWFSKEDINMMQETREITTVKDRRDYVKEILNIKYEIPLKSTGLNYNQFRSMIALQSNKKYADLTSIQLETLRDKVLYALDAEVDKHIKMWEILMGQIEEVAYHNKIKLI